MRGIKYELKSMKRINAQITSHSSKRKNGTVYFCGVGGAISKFLRWRREQKVKESSRLLLQMCLPEDRRDMFRVVLESKPQR